MASCTHTSLFFSHSIGSLRARIRAYSSTHTVFNIHAYTRSLSMRWSCWISATTWQHAISVSSLRAYSPTRRRSWRYLSTHLCPCPCPCPCPRLSPGLCLCLYFYACMCMYWFVHHEYYFGRRPRAQLQAHLQVLDLQYRWACTFNQHCHCQHAADYYLATQSYLKYAYIHTYIHTNTRI